MTGRVGPWFHRRVLRADLEDGEMVSSTGASVVTLAEYLEDGPGGRLFWLLASVLQLLLFLGLPIGLAVSVAERPDLDWTDPARLVLGGLVTLVSWWCALVWQSSVRAMVRGRHEPRRDPS